jgi:leishmanolysin-like peptidase
MISVLLLLLSTTERIESNSQLRSSSSPQNHHQPHREHVIRRIYGEENALVRREVSLLEERMQRYQTGFNADPEHEVSYENHPYDQNRRRHLQSNNNMTTDLFKPMRIVFETKALDDIRDSTNAAKIDWYKTQILPITREFWSNTLSVVPVSGNLRISSGELDSFAYCGDAEFTEVPNEHKSDGVANADLILYVSGSASTRFCPARTLAVAVPCNFDQFDRPTAGAINVCLDNIELAADGTASQEVVQDYVDVTIHEVGHVLGHSSNSYRFFWDPDTGKPRTERPFQARTVTCVNGETRSLVLPAENTMLFVEESDSRRYASIVTPKVQAVARNQFNCQTLAGAQLENQPTRSESCTGDHWDERLYYPEALSGVISPTTNILSSLTLALMEDSGWYKANYTNSRMSPWGLGAGCEFVQGSCLTVQQQDDGSSRTTIPNYAQGFFCNKAGAKGCSSEHTHKLACTILDYYYIVPQDLPVEPYVYFPNEATKGGPRQADFCPVYGTVYDGLKSEQLACANPDNAPTLNVYRYV